MGKFQTTAFALVGGGYGVKSYKYNGNGRKSHK